MTSFNWQCQPEAEKLLAAILADYSKKNQKIFLLEKDLRELTSTRLFDWVDHIVVDVQENLESTLLQYGFEQEHALPSYRVYTHHGAKLPSLLIADAASKHQPGIAVKVESIADFLMVRGIERCIEGTPLSLYRRCEICQENGIALFVIERRGSRTMEPVYSSESYIDDCLTAQELWQSRMRDIDETEGLDATLQLTDELVSLIGKNPAAWIVLECERKYWQSRNTAAQLQKNRQDRLGLGWANHDHHTFRSSRILFRQLVTLFEKLGFHPRERFYAGAQAGWGAQVMENSECGLVLFLDVDLNPDELDLDFSHHDLPESDHLGTIGLWCALHGDSILKGGMHHLEAQFLFERMTEDLAQSGIGMMDPYSNFSYLHQAFTQGEKWQVSPKRIERLLQKKMITQEQAEHFLENGAVGSHLENLERNEGYKGFNKDNVSTILKRTDPRTIAM